MTGKERPAVNHDDLPVRKGFLKTFPRNLIHRRTCSRKQHSPIDYQEVCIRSRQSVIIQVKRFRKRERNQIVTFPINCPELAQLPLHLCKWLIMRVIRICALHIGNRIRRAESCKDIDMAVSVVTYDGAMVKPENPLQSEGSTKFLFNLLL